jgi:SAM-dependent methyltransferase
MNEFDNKVQAWDESYARHENHVFYPSEEVVRFVSRHIRRRIGLSEFLDIIPGAQGSRVLDVGCGIGRTLIFGTQMGLQMHGMDLSASAVAIARQWLRNLGIDDADERVRAGDVRSLAWDQGYFHHAISDSVLDSMPFSIACEGVAEVARVLRSGGYFYCSLISGDETGRSPDFAGERVVTETHERSTIQSYFNESRIRQLLEPNFQIVSHALHQVRNFDDGTHHGRWHVTARRL